MSENLQDDEEQPEYQWVEDFLEEMFTLLGKGIQHVITILVALFNVLFSRQPPADDESEDRADRS